MTVRGQRLGTDMAYTLLAIVVMFFATVGYGLASWELNVWALIVFTVAAVMALHVSYVGSLVLLSFMHHS